MIIIIIIIIYQCQVKITLNLRAHVCLSVCIRNSSSIFCFKMYDVLIIIINHNGVGFNKCIYILSGF